MVTIEVFNWSGHYGTPFPTEGSFPVLTIKRPWIDLIRFGSKCIETRLRSFPRSYRGRIVLLHAGRKWGDEAVMNIDGVRELLAEILDMADDIEGYIILAAKFTDTIHYESEEHFLEDITRHHVTIEGYRPGIRGWPIVKLWEIEPIPHRGLPGFSTYEGRIYVQKEIRLKTRVYP